MQSGTYLSADEAAVTLPSPAELQAAADSIGDEWANSTAWLGCIVADGALMAGDAVAELHGLATAEECCRACRGMGGQCNAWTFCARAEGCRCACMSPQNARLQRPGAAE